MTERGLPVDTQRQGDIATIAWSRPAARNAIDSELAEQVAQAIDQVDGLASVVVLWPRPDFCAGWDLDELGRATTSGSAGVGPVLTAGRRLLDALSGTSSIVVAVVEGHALGFGLAVLAHCDHVVSAADTTYQLPELRAGMIPSATLPSLVTAVGVRRAQHWALGARFDAPDAHAAGLVDVVVDPSEMTGHIAALVAQLDSLDPDAVRATKALCRRLGSATPPSRAGIGDEATLTAFARSSGSER